MKRRNSIFSVLHWSTALAITACAVLTSANSPYALADDLMIETIPAETTTSDICGPFDPNCARRIARILKSIHILPVQVSGGVRFGENGAQGAVNFATQVAGLDVEVGDLRALIFEATYLPDAGGLRVRFNLADTDVLFFCKDDQGVTHAPIAALFAKCRPEGLIGIGGTVTQIQWDTATKRVAARWIEINAVLNFLRNANGMDYLKKRLNGYLGLSVDTVWYGDTPGAHGSNTALRANVGVTGMLRSNDNQWEIRGLAGYRPNVAAWNDFSIEARAQVLHHLLLGPNTMADIGVDAHYQHNSIPANSMGVFVSDRDRNSAYLGAIFGITFQ